MINKKANKSTAGADNRIFLEGGESEWRRQRQVQLAVARTSLTLPAGAKARRWLGKGVVSIEVGWRRSFYSKMNRKGCVNDKVEGSFNFLFYFSFLFFVFLSLFFALLFFPFSLNFFLKLKFKIK